MKKLIFIAFVSVWRRWSVTETHENIADCERLKKILSSRIQSGRTGASQEGKSSGGDPGGIQELTHSIRINQDRVEPPYSWCWLRGFNPVARPTLGRKGVWKKEVGWWGGVGGGGCQVVWEEGRHNLRPWSEVLIPVGHYESVHFFLLLQRSWQWHI